MALIRVSYCLLVLLGMGSESLLAKHRVDADLGGGAEAQLKSNGYGFGARSMQSLRRGPASADTAAASASGGNNEHYRKLSSVVSGDLAGAISPTDNPDSCTDEYGSSSCVNGCPSLWYTVEGTGFPMTASSCIGGIGFAGYDQRIIVWGGTSCYDKQCVGTSKVSGVGS
jgi:hypothetical protein